MMRRSARPKTIHPRRPSRMNSVTGFRGGIRL